jgi:hypothetical protein
MEAQNALNWSGSGPSPRNCTQSARSIGDQPLLPFMDKDVGNNRCSCWPFFAARSLIAEFQFLDFLLACGCSKEISQL